MIRRAVRCASVRVLPVPAPAMINKGERPCSTTLRWESLSALVPTFVEATWGAFSALAFTAGFAEALSVALDVALAGTFWPWVLGSTRALSWTLGSGFALVSTTVAVTLVLSLGSVAFFFDIGSSDFPVEVTHRVHERSSPLGPSWTCQHIDYNGAGV